MKWTSYNKQQRELNRDADHQRTLKHIWYCELVIAFCLGASVVLAGILFHIT